MTDFTKLKPPGFDPSANADGCRFDQAEAERACQFFELFLKHHKGEHGGKPFVLEPWEQAFIGHLFGWKMGNRRRFQEAFLFVARKNGKTQISAGIALYLLLADGEAGAEVYTAAAERDQGKLIFEAAKRMVEADSKLSEMAECYQHSLYVPKTGSSLKSLTSEAASKHGYNPHGILVDELHAHPSRDLVETLMTGTGSRRQPLTVHLTTAGFDQHSICYEKYDYACKVRDGIVADPHFLPVIFEADKDDDWTSIDTWRKANPNLGVTIKEDYLVRECQRARESPSYENTFRRLHLNQWTEQDVRWLSMDKWDDGDAELTDLEGQPCWGGLDLSTTTDLTALVLAFPGDDGVIYARTYAWCPRESMIRREKRDRAPYTAWDRRGCIESTEGNGVDYEVIRARINDLGERYNIQEIGVDRWNAEQLMGQLMGDGFQIKAFGQGFRDMSAPSKELERLVLEGKLVHGGHPVLRWCASNVTIETDAAGNIKPSKKKSIERIDAIVALVMAIGVASVAVEQSSFYEEHGLEVL